MKQASLRKTNAIGRHLHEVHVIAELIEAEDTGVVSRGWEMGGNGRFCSRDLKFQLC